MISVDETKRANEIVSNLKANYGIHILVDWGSSIPWSDACLWRHGQWELKDLEKVEDGIEKITSRGIMSLSQFRKVWDGTKILRVQDFGEMRSFAPPPGIINVIPGRADVLLVDNYEPYHVIHELAHVWDYKENKKLSEGLVTALDTWAYDKDGNRYWVPLKASVDPVTLAITYPEPFPGTKLNCTDTFFVCAPYAATRGEVDGEGVLNTIAGVIVYYNTTPGMEDWAESFATYVNPDYYKERKKTTLVPGGIRETYIKKIINEID